MVARTASELCHGHGSAWHGIRSSAGCDTQSPCPWGKAGAGAPWIALPNYRHTDTIGIILDASGVWSCVCEAVCLMNGMVGTAGGGDVVVREEGP